MNWVILAGYIAILTVLSILARKKAGRSPEEFFLAGRSFGSVILFLTLAATNFSAFFFLAFAGKAWTSGLGQYGIMGIGTALVPISFYFIGRKVWMLGKQKGYQTAPELLGGEFSSPFLRRLVLIVMLVFTIPYLLVQAVGAGIIISSLAGYAVTKITAVTVILLIGAVVVLGGMRGSAWTDVLQGGVMIVAMVAAVIFVAKGLGGFQAAGEKAFAASPSHFMRPGPDEFFTPSMWFSFIILWSFVNPLFPQLFTRFYTARSLRSLRASAWLYPLVVSFLFLAPVLIGVWARGTSLNLKNPNMVLPAMVAAYAPRWVHALVMTGALAALMSTADSQLLALSTMLARDTGIRKKQVLWGRILAGGLCVVVVILILAGMDERINIFTLLTNTSFAGLVVLTPATVAALYFKRISKWAVISSIIAGEATVVLLRLGILPNFGLVDGIVALIVAIAVLVVTAFITGIYNRLTPSVPPAK